MILPRQIRPLRLPHTEPRPPRLCLIRQQNLPEILQHLRLSARAATDDELDLLVRELSPLEFLPCYDGFGREVRGVAARVSVDATLRVGAEEVNWLDGDQVQGSGFCFQALHLFRAELGGGVLAEVVFVPFAGGGLALAAAG